MQPVLGPTWVEVDLDAIAHNVAVVLEAVAPARLLAVVKADAYGHGAVEVGRLALAAGAWGLGVSTLAEALELRAAGLAGPLLVLTPLRPEEAAVAVEARLTVTLATLPAARALEEEAGRRGRRVPVHLKVDTGMGRYGVLPDEAAAFAAQLAALPHLEVEGVFTHLASAWARDLRGARRQVARFRAAAEAAEGALGRAIPLRHAAASAAVLTLPEATFDLVRVGNLLYGVRPCAHGRALDLRPAWRMYSTLTQVRVLPPGWSVGYGGQYRTRRETVVATLPVGFADGFGVEPVGRLTRLGPLLRALGRALLRLLGLERRLALGAAAGTVELAGRELPVLGRIGMQQVTVDVTGVTEAREGAVVRVHCRPSSASARLARVYLRDGVRWRARSLVGTVDLAGAAAPDG